MIPPGYERRTARGATGWAVAAAADWLAEVLASGGTLHSWAARQRDAEALHGRGAVYSVPAPAAGPEGRPRWAVRHYRRGGAIASLLDDRYLRGGRTRPEIETRASVDARARGVPTPAVVAGAWYAAGAFYRADLATELIGDARSLADVLFSDPRSEVALAALAAAGRLAREAGARGLDHPDLNAMNVLVEAGPAPAAYVLDLDRARVHEVPSASSGRAMFERLTRSLRKLGRASGTPLSSEEVDALRAGFEGLT